MEAESFGMFLLLLFFLSHLTSIFCEHANTALSFVVRNALLILISKCFYIVIGNLQLPGTCNFWTCSVFFSTFQVLFKKNMTTVTYSELSERQKKRRKNEILAEYAALIINKDNALKAGKSHLHEPVDAGPSNSFIDVDNDSTGNNSETENEFSADEQDRGGLSSDANKFVSSSDEYLTTESKIEGEVLYM